jgi:hypothetical protein
MFRKVKTEIRVARPLAGYCQKADAQTHRHARVGIVQRPIIDPDRGQDRRGIVAHHPEA